MCNFSFVFCKKIKKNFSFYILMFYIILKFLLLTNKTFIIIIKKVFSNKPRMFFFNDIYGNKI